MDLALGGRTAVVTGGARGIGKAIAARIAAEGARVAIVDIASPEVIAATIKEIDVHGTGGLPVQCDVSDHEAVGRMVAEVQRNLGPIEILVNNAGIVRRKTILDVSPEEWNAVLATNLGGCFNCSQHIGRAMVDAGNGGRIVNISSIHGRLARAGVASYCASKSAIDMVTKQMAVELAPHGIAVNAVACGAIETEINYPLYRSAEPTHVVLQQATRQRIPTGQFGQPEDIGGAVAFLSSGTAARYITGAILYVDGGYVADGTVRYEEPTVTR
jgi:glucose 1-dehydrogenase